MKTSMLFACAASFIVAAAALPAAAQTDGPSQAPSGITSNPTPTEVTTKTPRPGETITESVPTRGEPNVQQTVIEDKSTRIDELKVRGQTKRITVTPKRATRLQYEILPEDGTGFGDSTASQTPHGNSGRRVWNVLSF